MKYFLELKKISKKIVNTGSAPNKVLYFSEQSLTEAKKYLREFINKKYN
mgnify:CR=1 FL=1